MKTIVFGATGFIGSHVAEQLYLAGHDVTAVARHTSNTAFLDELGVRVIRIDFRNQAAIGEAVYGHEVVYNCTADAKLDTQISMDAEVEVKLARTLAEESAKQGVSRFIQLSTIVLYDFKTGEPMDEAYVSEPAYPVQHLALRREAVVREVGKRTGMDTVILRPASTIGLRDQSSFFARLLAAHASGTYPLVGGGSTTVSLVDTRDLGRAMVLLGTYYKPALDDGIYVLKGFDTTWRELKAAMDEATGKAAQVLDIPLGLTDEQMRQFHLSPFALQTFTVNRVWDDGKIRRLGFVPKYTLTDAVRDAAADIRQRMSPAS